ncbi:MAG: hypothetical protein K0R20_814 [Actinomycetia bacterium]|nr:hypothetical protein [Actinomycetes bacterium]
MLAQFVIHARGRQAVGSSLANEMAELREDQLAGDTKKRARTKWLHANGAEASFPCGVVHVEDEAVPVLVAIVPDGIAFLAETPQGASVYDVLEMGRIPRSDLTEVDVVDVAGRHMPEPLRESFEPDVDVWIVLRWTRDGQEHEDRFALVDGVAGHAAAPGGADG